MRSTALLAAAAGALAQSCRDQNTWPYSAASIWNTAIGSGAVYAPADLFNTTATLPQNFFSDDDYFIVTQATDPVVDWFSQGWWGQPGGAAHCNITGNLQGQLHWPLNTTVTVPGNNAAAILQPDNRTLVLTQPLYVCTPGAPVLSLYDPWHGVGDIRGNGTWGGHGGSSLNAIGGTIRRGELMPGAGAMRHALKAELFAAQFYYGSPAGANRSTCYHWPALNCDGYALTPGYGMYNGSNPLLTPGSLLAIPPAQLPGVLARLATAPAQSLAWTLANYGAYLVDDTYEPRGTLCTEHGFTDDFQAAWGFPFETLPGQPFYADLLTLFQALSIVANNGPSSVGGGGTPLQPPPPDFCD